MSRGSRAPVTGNISLSMRDNYGEHGVEQVCFALKLTALFLCHGAHDKLFSIIKKLDQHTAIHTIQASAYVSLHG